MVVIAPFCALRFDPDVVGDLDAVTAPPYDAIDEQLERELQSRSRFNVVRLELGRDTSRDDPHRYERATTIFGEWMKEGALRRDDEASMFLYEQQAIGAAPQLGVLAALQLEPWEAGVVLPHEHVYPGPVEDRLQLLRHLPVNTSPVFVIHSGPPLASFTDLHPPSSLATFTDDDGTLHSFSLLPDAAARAYAAALAPHRALMADGHHRYTTALAYQARATRPGSDALLAFIASTDEVQPPRPMMRVTRDDPDLDVLHRHGVEVTPRDPLEPRALRDDTVVEFAVTLRAGDVYDLAAARDDLLALTPELVGTPLAHVDLVLVDHAVLRGMLGVDPGDVAAVPMASMATMATMTTGAARVGAAWSAAAPTLAQVWAVADAGARLPPKSTWFFPKPRTGLVLRPLE